MGQNFLVVRQLDGKSSMQQARLFDCAPKMTMPLIAQAHVTEVLDKYVYQIPFMHPVCPLASPNKQFSNNSLIPTALNYKICNLQFLIQATAFLDGPSTFACIIHGKKECLRRSNCYSAKPRE